MARPNRKRGTIGKYTEYDKDRQCLKCEKMFSSYGPENRVCVGCRVKNQKFEGEMKYGKMYEILINKRWVAGG